MSINYQHTMIEIMLQCKSIALGANSSQKITFQLIHIILDISPEGILLLMRIDLCCSDTVIQSLQHKMKDKQALKETKSFTVPSSPLMFIGKLRINLPSSHKFPLYFCTVDIP